MKKVYPDVRKNYFNAHEALYDAGYEYIGTGVMRSGKTFDAFKKDGQVYRYHGMEHFNTIINQINLVNITNTDVMVDLIPPIVPDSESYLAFAD